MAYVIKKGSIFNAPFRKNMVLSIEGLLNDVGTYGVKVVQSNTKKSKSSGRLHDSIMFATARGGSAMGSKAKSTDAIEAPKDPYEVVIASGVPYAPYLEKGTPAHKTSKGHEEFVADLKDWYTREFGMHPDSSPETRFHFWNIYEKIAVNGTKEQPFIMPSRSDVEQFAMKRMAKALKQMLQGGKR